MKKRLGPEEWAVIRLALVAAFGEAGYAVVNALALPMFVSRELHATLRLGLIYGSFDTSETSLDCGDARLQARVCRGFPAAMHFVGHGARFIADLVRLGESRIA